METSNNNSNGWKNLTLAAGASILLTMGGSYFLFAFNAVRPDEFDQLRARVNDMAHDVIKVEDFNRIRDQVLILQGKMSSLDNETAAQRRELENMKAVMIRWLERVKEE